MSNKLKWNKEIVLESIGRYICRNSCDKTDDDIGFLCSITYKIGYITGSSKCICMIAITDGMTICYKSDSADACDVFADELNSREHEYRLLSGEEVRLRMNHLNRDKQ